MNVGRGATPLRPLQKQKQHSETSCAEALAATKIGMNSSSESVMMNLDVGHLGEHIESLYGQNIKLI